MRVNPLCTLGLVIFAAGCSENSPARTALNSLKAGIEQAAPPDTIPEMLEYAADLRVNIADMAKLPDGTLYEDVAAGEGTPAAPGDSVTIRFDGWLPDGTHVDSATVALRLGSGSIIPGIDIAIPGMKPGGRRKLVVPPGLAFGEEGRDAIPPFAVLVYDVVLQGILP